MAEEVVAKLLVFNVDCEHVDFFIIFCSCFSCCCCNIGDERTDEVLEEQANLEKIN